MEWNGIKKISGANMELNTAIVKAQSKINIKIA